MSDNLNLTWQTRDDMPFPTNALQKLHEALAFTSQDCGENKLMAFMYGVILGWDDLAYSDLKKQHNWSDSDIELQKMWHENYGKAWELFMSTQNKQP